MNSGDGLMAMNGEDQPLVTNEPVKLDKEPVKVQDFMKITNHFRRNYEIHFKLIKKNRKTSTCSQLNLEILHLILHLVWYGIFFSPRYLFTWHFSLISSQALSWMIEFWMKPMLITKDWQRILSIHYSAGDKLHGQFIICVEQDKKNWWHYIQYLV